jgi:GlpG protein
VLALSITMSLASNFGSRVGVLRHFTIAGNIFLPGHGYDDILAGELWRLITPVFIHFGVLHLVFNAFWLLDVGAAIERVLGSLRFGTFLAFCAAASNAAQLYFGLSAMFGGLSGLVYACVGYLWSRGRFDPHSPIGAPPQLVTFFVVWLILGFTGALFDLVGNVANYCHLGGLIAGVACGYVAALSSKPRVPRSAQQ